MKPEKIKGFQTDGNRLKSVPQGLPVRAALLALRFYKTYLSFLFAGNCRFDPTCSQYAYQAIERFGVLRGIWLGLKRLLRCHPLSRKFGHDPVPETLNSMSFPPRTTSRDVPAASREEIGFCQSRVTSHQSLSSIRYNSEIQDKVHS